MNSPELSGYLGLLHNRSGGQCSFLVLNGGSMSGSVSIFEIQSYPNRIPIFFHQPVPHHAICNIGDTLAVFSGGILWSNLHRILYDAFTPYSCCVSSGHHLDPQIKLELNAILWSTPLVLATQLFHVHSLTKVL